MQTPPGNAPEPHFTGSRAEQASQPAIQPEPPTSYLRKSGKACFGRFDRMLQSQFPFMQFLHFINPPQDLQSSSKFQYIPFRFIIKPEFAILPLFFYFNPVFIQINTVYKFLEPGFRLWRPRRFALGTRPARCRRRILESRENRNGFPSGGRLYCEQASRYLSGTPLRSAQSRFFYRL